LICPVGADENG